jgi:hypothetical protein
MGIGGLLPQRCGRNARRLVARLSKFKTAFTLSSFACCAVHWLLTHNFSVYMVSVSLLFGRHSGNVYRMAFRLVLFGEGVAISQ